MTQFAARQYTKWLSGLTGRFYRLPAESEWEYACRAGTTTLWNVGDDVEDLDDAAWFADNSDEAPHPVGGKAANAFVAMRPPGHHAEISTPMGFCFVYNAAIAARHAQAAHGATRVAIMDFDVHHGNGTQDIFWADGSVMYASTHQMPLFPGTGAANEIGEMNTIVNAPLRAGDAGPQFRHAMESAILPRLIAFRPDLVIISAGFDAHQRDPLAQINLLEEDFAWATARLMDVADASAGGRLVSLLEGGYDLTALAGSVSAHVSTLMGRSPGAASGS